MDRFAQAFNNIFGVKAEPCVGMSLAEEINKEANIYNSIVDSLVSKIKVRNPSVLVEETSDAIWVISNGTRVAKLTIENRVPYVEVLRNGKLTNFPKTEYNEYMLFSAPN